MKRFTDYQPIDCLLIKKQEGRESEVLEARSVVLLHEHRENKSDEEIHRLSIQ